MRYKYTNSIFKIYLLFLLLFLVIPSSSRAVNTSPRTVRVGVYQNEPKVFIDKAGHPAGIFIDLLKEIAKQEHWKLVYVPGDWTACLKSLEDGKIDLMLDVAYSEERNKLYDFHKTPVLESWSRIYSSSGNPIKKISDLKGKRIAVLKGSIQQTVFQQLMDGFGYQVTIIPTDSFNQAFAMAAHNTVDGAISNHLFGDYFYQKYGLSKTAIDFDPVALYYVTAKGRNPELLESIDRYLSKWIPKPGSPYYTTLGHWSEKPTAYRVPKYVYWILIAIAGLLLTTVGIVYLLRQQVKVRTRHLAEANAKLQESEHRYRTLVEKFQDIVFITDLSGGILYANPALERETGYTIQDFQSPHHDTFFNHYFDSERIFKFNTEFIRSPEPISTVVESIFCDKHDAIHWHSYVITKTDYQGRSA
ncbi:MAG: transporter substrate-binding domain-containing protein, partial [bacterium]